MKNDEKINENQQEESPKKQERLDFMTYLKKTEKEREQRRKEGKSMSGLEGTPINVKRNTGIVQSENLNITISAEECAAVFKKAKEEEKKHKKEQTVEEKQKDEGKERE